MNQRLVTIPSDPIVVEAIRAGYLTVLPIPKFFSAAIGDLICFESSCLDEAHSSLDYVYAVVRDVKDAFECGFFPAESGYDISVIHAISDLSDVIVG